MKSTWFGSRNRYEFCKLIEQGGGYGQMMYNSLDQWLELAWLSLRQSANVFACGELDEKVEERVLKLQSQSKDWAKYAQAMGVLAIGIEQDGSDFLGQCFQELALNDKSCKGQCFTPMEVCRCMAEMSLLDAKPESGKTFWLSEPACGGGAMVIATSDVLKSKGFYPWHYHWNCVDVDWRCAAMTFIQTTLLGIPAVVVHGNSLTLEVRESHRNIISLMHPPKRESRDSVAPAPVLSVASEGEAVGEFVQLELF